MTVTEYMKDIPVAAVSFAAGNVEGDGLKTILVSPDGVVESRNGTFVMDAEAAREIIADFQQHGADVPIDFEHQTLGGDYSSPDGRAPAAGWITKVWYERGRGLLGFVWWNPKAREMIRGGEYRYLSPTLSVRKADGRAVALHSAALTNKPAIPRMDKLAASSRLTDTETKPMANEDGQAEQVLALVKEIQATLKLSAAEGDLLTGLTAIRDAVKELMVDVELENSAVASSVREVLGLSPNAGKAEVVLAMKTRAGGEESAELTALREREAERAVQDLIQPYIEANKLNPNDTAAMEAARHLARTQPDRLVALMANATPYVQPGRTKAPSVEQCSRYRIINEAQRTYRTETTLQKTTSAVAFANNALREAKLAPMSDAEKLDLVTV